LFTLLFATASKLRNRGGTATRHTYPPTPEREVSRYKFTYAGKLTVVFDLDETLVHCFEELSEPHEVEILVRFEDGGMMVAPLNIRPQVRELLTELSKNFELMVFTASHQRYADAVLDYLDPENKHIQHRLYRQHCQYLPEGYYVKDLRVLGRDLSKVVLVDNAAYSYSFQVDNGIPILPYYEGSTDFELKALRNYLMGLTGDVR
jgi:CTD small phosphatase-like protein 2